MRNAPAWPLVSTVRLSLAGFTGEHAVIEVRRLPARYGQRLPVVMGPMLGEENNLPAMVRVVRDLTIGGLHHGVGFAANSDGPLQIFFA